MFSSRKIALASERDLAFIAIVGNERPDFRTISDFRKDHLEADEAALGSRRGDELPAELERREKRLATIEAAMQRLEAQAKADAEAERKRRAEADAERERTGQKRRGRAPKPVEETPPDQAQMSFTDAELPIMPTNNKGWDSCGNAQASVDEAYQII